MLLHILESGINLDELPAALWSKRRKLLSPQQSLVTHNRAWSADKSGPVCPTRDVLLMVCCRPVLPQPQAPLTLYMGWNSPLFQQAYSIKSSDSIMLLFLCAAWAHTSC